MLYYEQLGCSDICGGSTCRGGREEDTQGPPRRVYRLTELGNDVLCWWTSDLRETAQIIDHFLDTYRRHMEEGEGEYH